MRERTPSDGKYYRAAELWRNFYNVCGAQTLHMCLNCGTEARWQ